MQSKQLKTSDVIWANIFPLKFGIIEVGCDRGWTLMHLVRVSLQNKCEYENLINRKRTKEHGANAF